MTANVQITVEPKLIRVVYRGKVEIDATTEMLRKVGRIASENHIQHLLFDLREADYRNYYVGTIQHTEDGPSFGIKQTFHVAFLGKEGEPMLRYIEDVTVNRGFQSKTFTDESEAIAWLHGAP
jgi:SpoIIAA-like